MISNLGGEAVAEGVAQARAVRSELTSVRT